VEKHGRLNTVRQQEAAAQNLLVEIFLNGELRQEWSLEQIRERTDYSLGARLLKKWFNRPGLPMIT
jgi:DNA mismatch repair ATPase MutS